MRKNNKSNIAGKNSMVSKSSEKKSDVLIQIDELMAELDNEYGPLMIKELQNRIIKTISDFKYDLETVLVDVFEQHKDRYKKINSSNEVDDTEESDIPSFIAEYENKKSNK